MASLGAAALAAVYALSPLATPPLDATNRFASDPAAAQLGQYLFFYPGFSADGKISCASCHQPSHAFSDGRPLAKGLATGTRNTPTLLNVAYGHWFFLDGRADSLWSQPDQVFRNPKEMGSSRRRVAHAVESEGALKRAYERIFGPMPPLARRGAVDRVVADVGKALEAYERKLVSRDAPFDRYVAALRRGDPDANTLLSPAAKRGLELFIGPAHCTLCHSGPDFSDGEFHNLGLPRLSGRPLDTGRADGLRTLAASPFNGAGPFSDAPHGAAAQRIAYLPSPEAELGKFKTPTLRNVARTAPYMHDGRFASLREVLEFYAKGKAADRGLLVGQREATLDLIPHLTLDQISDLIAFLDSLTGAPLPAALARQPETP
ncbi:MAG: cytochrome c peroxidase [Burkholderiales bacterium]